MQLDRPRKVLSWLHMIFLIAVGALLLSLDLKILSIRKGANVVKISNYSMLGLSL